MVKALQGAVAVVVVGLTGAVIYHFYSSSTIDRRVQETADQVDSHQKKIETVEGKLKVHDQGLREAEKTGQAHARDIGDIRTRIEELRKRVQDLEVRTDTDREELRKMRAEIDRLAREHQANRNDVDALRKQLDQRARRDAETEQRLQAIEKKLGIERPQP
jgi:chromosome segregation ATPase